MGNTPDLKLIDIFFLNKKKISKLKIFYVSNYQ